MSYFLGCIFIIVLALIYLVVMLVGKTLNFAIKTIVWLWESFLNLFRTMKKEVRNPWTGISNFEKEDILEHERRQREQEQAYQEDGSRPKMYDKNDGEYIDFTEIK